jgi:serine/threonine-protein kinase
LQPLPARGSLGRQVSHASVVTIHDIGIEESKQTPDLVMELVEGQSLEKIISKGCLPFPSACEYVAHVAVALSIARKRALIHGDVKPANILISNKNRVKLTDLGMARLAAHQNADFAIRRTPASTRDTGDDADACPQQQLGGFGE